MKILFVQDSFGAGGAESSNVLLWKYLRSKGVDIHIIALYHSEVGYEEEVLKENYSTTFLKPGNILQQSYQIAQYIKQISPDIVHSVLFKSNIRVRLAKLHAKFLHVEHLVSCTYDKIRLKDPQLNKLGFHIYKYLDIATSLYGVNHFIAITNQVKQHYCKVVKISDSKIIVINRGRYGNIFLEQRAKIRESLLKSLNLRSDKIIILHVGRQEYAKGHLVLLRSLNKLFHTEYSLWNKIHIIFCGRNGNESTAISAYLDEHPDLMPNLSWLGQRNDIQQLMVASDIFVFPSLYEGLGGSLIEAQAAGLPIICSNLSVFHEVVKEHENALMFPQGDYLKLAEQVVKLLNEDSLKEVMGKNSLKNFNEKFRLEKINEDTLNFYRQIIA